MSVYLKQFSTHAEYEAALSSLILPNVSFCKDTPNEVHYNPYVDPCASEKVKTTYEWVEIGGVKWATKNVGALTVTDYGQCFQWADTQGYTADQVSGDCHSKAFTWEDYKYGTGGSTAADMTKYNNTDGLTVLESSDDAATVNMGSGWRMPTKDEYLALGRAVNTAWTVDYQGSGVSGMICTDKTDNSKVLFFPVTDYCDDGVIKGTVAVYWSNTRSSDAIYACRISLSQTSSIWLNEYGRRNIGYPVRGVYIG